MNEVNLSRWRGSSNQISLQRKAMKIYNHWRRVTLTSILGHLGSFNGMGIPNNTSVVSKILNRVVSCGRIISHVTVSVVESFFSDTAIRKTSLVDSF